MISGKVFVIIFVVVGLVAAAASTWIMLDGYDAARRNQAGIGPRMVHRAAEVWADEHDGAYPAHLALLRSSNFFRRDMLIDPRRFTDSAWIVGGIDVRPWMDRIGEDAADFQIKRQAFEYAVTTSSSEPFYQLGDYFFARLPRPIGHADLVFAWTRPDEQGRKFIVFDSGHTQRVDVKKWAEAWRADAKAREEIGLPAATPSLDIEATK